MPIKIGFIVLWVFVLAVHGDAQQELAVELVDGVEMDFVWIEPGTFLMGTWGPEDDEDKKQEPEEYISDQRPQNQVTISQGFWLGKYEITPEQWEGVMGSRPWEGQDGAPEMGPYPAVLISWDDVQEFIIRLNAVLEEPLYRLPSEAEWEYACRAGSESFWSFGNGEKVLGDYAWYDDNAWDIGETYVHAVGVKLPNLWGLYDMHGNAEEWVQDRYAADYYKKAPFLDPPGPEQGVRRVLRGGNFSSPKEDIGAAVRNKANPSFNSVLFGARLLLERGPFTAIQRQSWGRFKVRVP